MLTLNDGRKELYQWDTGRAATVDIDCDIVHFANLKYGESLAVEVKEGKVSIPNKLLMSGEPIYCYAFVKDDNGAYTKKEQTISVTKRAKPSDYVYTDTEVITIETALNDALEKAKESGDFKGDKGEKGDQGMPGPQGEKGDQGIPGEKGAKGDKGDKGDIGAQGIQGVKGDPGEQGIQGVPGAKGDKGDPGVPGAKGDKGDPGDTPYIGENGNWFIGDTDTGVPASGTGGTPNAVQYVPQTLTQEQKTQARKNIDAQSQVYAVKRANPWSAEDCMNAPVRGLKLYGATEQKQYSGKNLYDMSLQQTTTKNGLTFSYIADEDCFCINGTCTLNDSYIIDTFKVPIDQNQSYTLTCYPVSGSVTAADGLFKTLYVECGDTETEYTAFETIDVGTVKKTRTETNTKSFYTRTRYFINEGVVFNNLKFRIQFEKNSTSTDYEPYVGGEPSPSPNYPQPVKVNNLTYSLIGKNLFNTAVLPSSGWNKKLYYYLPIYVGTGKSLIISHKKNLNTGLGFVVGVSLYEKNAGSSIESGWIYHESNYNLIKNKIQVVSKEDYIYLSISGKTSNADQYVFLDDFQIEYGTEKTEYEPYYNGGSATAPSLYGIGDAQDEWDAMTGHGTRKIVKIEVDGITKTFNKANADAGSYAYYMIYNNSGDATVKKDALCTHLIKDISANNAGKFYCTGKTIFINASGIVTEDNATASNADALNTILAEKHTAGNPMTFYIASDDELFETTPAGQISMPDGYAQFLPSGDGAAGDVEAEYAVDIEKRYVPKETYKVLEERVSALELAAIGG